MSGCSKCQAPTMHSCGCKPKVDVWTRPLALGREDPCCGNCASGKPCSSESDCDAVLDQSACRFSWSITPIQATPSGTVTFQGVNLPPNATFQVQVTGTNTNYYWTVQSDAAGVATATMQLPITAGIYQFKPIVANCTALPLRNSVTVVASGPISPGTCDCLGSLTIRPVFESAELTSGTQVPLILVVTNTNSCPATDIILPPITLPSGLTSGSPIQLNNITVPGNSSTTFTYLVNTVNATSSDLQVGVTVPANTVTYKCGGVTHFGGGGSVYATIKSLVTGSCNLIIEEFKVAPLSITNGQSATYTLKVKNTGTNPISNISFGPISLSSAVVSLSPPVSLAGSGISLAAGASHTVTATANFTATPLSSGQQHAHQVLLPQATVTGTCNFGQVSNQMPMAATLVING